MTKGNIVPLVKNGSVLWRSVSRASDFHLITRHRFTRKNVPLIFINPYDIVSSVYCGFDWNVLPCLWFSLIQATPFQRASDSHLLKWRRSTCLWFSHIQMTMSLKKQNHNNNIKGSFHLCEKKSYFLLFYLSKNEVIFYCSTSVKKNYCDKRNTLWNYVSH